MAKNIFYVLAVLAVGFCVLFLNRSCKGPSPIEELEIALNQYGQPENEINPQELQFLEEIVIRQQRHKDFRQFFTRGTFDHSKLVDYIESKGYIIGLQRDIAINIYLENSGSMNGYVNGNTQFKDDFRELLVALKDKYGEEQINMYFINSEVHPTGIQGELVDIPSKLSPATINVGHTSASELNAIFKQVLAHTSGDTISILLSDCIYSVENGETPGQLNRQKTLTKDAFLSRFNPEVSLSTVVVKMKSPFNGFYYDKNDKPMNLGTGKAERPYYLAIIGNQQAITDFNTTIELSANSFEGFVNKHIFSTEDFSERITYLPVKTKSDKSRWAYRSNQIEAKDDRRTGAPLSFALAADFSDIPVSDDYISNRTHYNIVAGDYELLAVTRYDKGELTPQSGNNVSKFDDDPTHLLEFRATSVAYTDLVFSLKRQLPPWVYDTDTDDDTNIHLDKTFGFRYLMSGISEAYEAVSATDSCYFEIKINIK